MVELDGVDVSPQNVPKGVTPKHYSHVAVVFDTASHHWIETHEW